METKTIVLGEQKPTSVNTFGILKTTTEDSKLLGQSLTGHPHTTLSMESVGYVLKKSFTLCIHLKTQQSIKEMRYGLPADIDLVGYFAISRFLFLVLKYFVNCNFVSGLFSCWWLCIIYIWNKFVQLKLCVIFQSKLYLSLVSLSLGFFLLAKQV